MADRTPTDDALAKAQAALAPTHPAVSALDDKEVRAKPIILPRDKSDQEGYVLNTIPEFKFEEFTKKEEKMLQDNEYESTGSFKKREKIDIHQGIVKSAEDVLNEPNLYDPPIKRAKEEQATSAKLQARHKEILDRPVGNNITEAYQQKIGGGSMINNVTSEDVDPISTFKYFTRKDLEDPKLIGKEIDTKTAAKFVKRCYEIEIFYLHAMIAQAWFSYTRLREDHILRQKRINLYNLLLIIRSADDSPAYPAPPGVAAILNVPEDTIKLPKSVINDIRGMFKDPHQSGGVGVGTGIFKTQLDLFNKAGLSISEELGAGIASVEITIPDDLKDEKIKETIQKVSAIIQATIQEDLTIGVNNTLEWKHFLMYYIKMYVTPLYHDEIKNLLETEKLNINDKDGWKQSNSDNGNFHFIKRDSVKPNIDKIDNNVHTVSGDLVTLDKKNLSKYQVHLFFFKCRELEMDIYKIYKNIHKILMDIAEHQKNQAIVIEYYYTILSKYTRRELTPDVPRPGPPKPVADRSMLAMADSILASTPPKIKVALLPESMPTQEFFAKNKNSLIITHQKGILRYFANKKIRMALVDILLLDPNLTILDKQKINRARIFDNLETTNYTSNGLTDINELVDMRATAQEAMRLGESLPEVLPGEEEEEEEEEKSSYLKIGNQPAQAPAPEGGLIEG